MSFEAKPIPADDEILSFTSPPALRRWLERSYNRSNGFWLRIYKKAANERTVTYAEALDQALCYGWIDAQRKPYDERSFLQKLRPRLAKSSWSLVNTRHVTRLLAAREMKAPGLAAVDDAKADGRWDAAYPPQSSAEPPQDLLVALKQNKSAQAHFATLNKGEIYRIIYRLSTAKGSETRAKRLTRCIELLAQGKRPSTW